MILAHEGKSQAVAASAYIAPNSVVCGDVRIGAGCRVMFGACVVAEGKPITIGENCIVMENAAIRSTDEHELKVGNAALWDRIPIWWVARLKMTSSFSLRRELRCSMAHGCFRALKCGLTH
jgi:NDP-sugar pyrophosphorylase family protein